MRPSDPGFGAPRSHESFASASRVPRDGEDRRAAAGAELAAIIRRAETLGIPAWRVALALGVALPVAVAR